MVTHVIFLQNKCHFFSVQMWIFTEQTCLIYRTNALLACKIQRKTFFLQNTCRFCKLIGHLFCKPSMCSVRLLQNKCAISFHKLHVFCRKTDVVWEFCKLIGHLFCNRFTFVLQMARVCPVKIHICSVKKLLKILHVFCEKTFVLLKNCMCSVQPTF